MAASGRWFAVVVVIGIMITTSPAHAQDALRGKRLYLDAARVVGTGVSCVDCHGGLPGGLFGIGSAANDPARVENAIGSIPDMAPFRDRLTAPDFADLAAFIGDPAVASPDARVTTHLPGGEPGAPERVVFGELEAEDTSEPAVLELRNAGMVAFMVTAAPEVSGSDAAEFSIETTDCVAGLLLAPAQSCRIAVVFAPTGVAGDRIARVVVAHDWVRGVAAVALFGSVRDRDQDRPPTMTTPSGCAITRTDGAPLIALVILALARRRRTTGIRTPGRPAALGSAGSAIRGA